MQNPLTQPVLRKGISMFYFIVFIHENSKPPFFNGGIYIRI